MLSKLYDETDPLSIENYAKKLIGKTFNDVLKDYENDQYKLLINEEKEVYAVKHENKKRKGGLGDLIEECYFHYKCNNDSRPDFPYAGVELKVTPYKINKKNSLSAKERLVITMIDYFKIVEENFEDSHLFNKSKLILLIYYLFSKDIKSRLDYKINYVKLFTPPKEDLEIIKNDFKIIVDKIKNGKAHELSEGDTMYLGASTKSASSNNKRRQPFSDELAKPRAFSFKCSYMTYVLNKYIAKDKTTYEPIIKDPNELKFTTFEEIIINKINSYVGKTDKELCKIFNKDYNNNKSQWIDLSYKMLGIKSNKAEEFEKANITVKALRIDSKGKIVESSPLPSFKFKDIINESWEESKLFQYLDLEKFLFVVYKKEKDTYILKGAQIWHIPYEDLNVYVKAGWEDIKRIILDGVKLTPHNYKGKLIYKNNFPNKSANKVIHIRPHAQKSAYKLEDGKSIGNISRDANELPDGRYMTNQSFWLNNTYILNQLDKNLIK